jgi:hypothetical protein
VTRTSRSQEFLLSRRVIGGLIVLGVILPIVEVIVVAVRGDLRGLTAAFRGVGGVGESASALGTVTLFAIPGLILLLVGFSLFTLLLWDAGDRGISVVAFTLWFAALILAIIEGTFQASVTVWAGKIARTGAVPELFEPLRLWMNMWVQRFYVPMGLVAAAAYGWATLDTRLLPRWVGWGAIRAKTSYSGEEATAESSRRVSIPSIAPYSLASSANIQ